MENENIKTGESLPIPTPKENRPMGALIGAIIVIFILVLGGIYLWTTKIQTKIMGITTDDQTMEQTASNLTKLEQTANTPDIVIDQIASQSPSDTTASIEADLNATDLNSLDKELQSI